MVVVGNDDDFKLVARSSSPLRASNTGYLTFGASGGMDYLPNYTKGAWYRYTVIVGNKGKHPSTLSTLAGLSRGAL